jgi:hypothetical protein
MNAEHGTDERDERDGLTDLVEKDEPQPFPAGLRARGGLVSSCRKDGGHTTMTTPTCRTRSSLLVVFALLSVGVMPGGLSAFPQQAPAASNGNAPQPTGTAKLIVSVVAADNGAPVSGTQVTLFGTVVPPQPERATAVPSMSATRAGAVIDAVPATSPSSGAPGVGLVLSPGPSAGNHFSRVATTNESGSVEFTSLPAGTYSLSVQRQGGYVTQPAAPSAPLSDGESSTVTVRLERTGAIAGRIVDANGDPIAHVSVRATQRAVRGSTVSRESESSGTTNDQGQFRLPNLAPGEYLVLASYSGPQSRLSANHKEADNVGYLPTYFPGTTADAAARIVTVRSNNDTGEIDFVLQRGKLGRVFGTATDSTGRSLGSLERAGAITLTRQGAYVPPAVMWASVQMDGSFVFRDVPPGDYQLSTTLMRGTGPDATSEGAYLPVSVNGNEVKVDIRTNVGAVVRGRVVVEAGPTTSAPGARGFAGTANPQPVTITTLGAGSTSASAWSPVTPRDDGSFELTGLRGSLHLTASGRDVAFVAVRQAGRDITGIPMELTGTERIDDLEIVLTRALGWIDGTVADRGGNPAPGAWVVAFPDDPSRYYQESPFVHMWFSFGPLPPMVAAARPWDSALYPAGRFSVPDLPAGRWLLVAIPREGGRPLVDRPTLLQLRARATAVDVKAGEMTQVHLTLAR